MYMAKGLLLCPNAQNLAVFLGFDVGWMGLLVCDVLYFDMLSGFLLPFSLKGI